MTSGKPSSDGSKPAHPSSEYPTAGLFPFVGRDSELARLRTLLCDPDVQLVTILGPGGFGKTSIALELADSLRTEFEHGVVFVPLSQLNTHDEILPALARVLGLQLPQGENLRQTVFDHLASWQALLILDNFEHLTAGAIFVHDLLAAAPQVKALATSREKLNLLGETLFHLKGLGLLPSGTVEQVRSCDAVRLFMTRARQVRPGFELSDADLPAVVEVCRMVDGMPLAILLAAAWVEHFSPQEIAAQIRDKLDFLSLDLQNIPERHRSIRAVFDSAFNRLDERQRSVFMKLAFFRDGFALEAAEAIAGADLQTLLALTNKSLLWRDPDSSRYDLHQLLRQYAYEKLSATGEVEKTKADHRQYYLDFICRREARLKSASQASSLDEIAADFENIRLAWSQAVEQRDFSAIGDATPGLYAFCDMRSWFHAGEALFRLARRGLLSRSGEPEHPACGLVSLSWYDLRTYIENFESFDKMIRQAERCLAGAQAARDARGMAASLVWRGAIAEDQNDFPAAIRCYQQGMQRDPQLDDFYWIIMRIGLCYKSSGQYQLAIQSFDQCLLRGEEVGERVKIGWALLNIGDTLIMQENQLEAVSYLENARDLFQEIGTTIGVLWANYSLSRIALALGNLDQSKELAERALELAQQIHSVAWLEKLDGLLLRIDSQPSFQHSKAAQSLIEPLSDRELEVLQLLKSDLSAPEIAQTLIVSLNTIRYHSKNIYRKLQVNNRREAVRRAQDLGL